ncbi:PEFG-CTERM sorting domain-containing protein [Nitrosopumilus sp. Nsub]|uniref:PEFG-CTERM sorting domain-containing protein n=1 Tax=Nitrosopumilus sp. Nsub TaxID=1776294 RepID=UPI000834BEFC|nr:PEFG-CTERM sorting domain-containing protein [Nitrosopumilus sp. Nsub]
MDLRIFFVLIILILIPVGTVLASGSLISVQTDDTTYDEGDTIAIFGQIETIIGQTPVTLQLFKDGNMVEIAQIIVSKDGNYSYTILAEGSMWQSQGEYVVKVTYGEGNIAETTFLYTPNSEVLTTTDIFEVDAGSSGTFDLSYTIRGGTLSDISVDENIFGLIVNIDASDEGKIVLDLPRKYIDAEKQNGKDEVFIILIEKQNGDVIETTYQEETSHSEIRTITIDFEPNDSKIQVIGTYVIPEFGTIVMIILTVGIMASVLLTRNRFQIKI